MYGNEDASQEIVKKTVPVFSGKHFSFQVLPGFGPKMPISRFFPFSVMCIPTFLFIIFKLAVCTKHFRRWDDLKNLNSACLVVHKKCGNYIDQSLFFLCKRRIYNFEK